MLIANCLLLDFIDCFCLKIIIASIKTKNAVKAFKDVIGNNISHNTDTKF